MEKCFVRNCVSGQFLSGVSLSRIPIGVSHQIFYVDFPDIALFLNYDEAQALIDFISDVLDYEVAEDLVVVSAVSSGYC